MHTTSWEMPGWMKTNWNQDYWEKYQQPQIWRWYHPNGSFWETHINMRSLSISPVQFSHSACLTLWPHGQASLSITNFWSLLKLMSIELMMPSNHLILCHPLLLLPSIFPRIRGFFNELVLWIGGQRTGVSASLSVLPMNIQDWSPLGWTGWISLQSKGVSRVFSNTTVPNKHHGRGLNSGWSHKGSSTFWPRSDRCLSCLQPIDQN